MRIDLMKYTWEHKKAFLKVEKQLLGKNTLTGYMHDTDKLFLYLFPIKKKTVQYIHRRLTRHHLESFRKRNYVEMVIDWECASLTKPDKQMNAYDTLRTLFPQLQDEIIPILNKYNL